MPTISADAADTIKLVRELQLLDESSVRLLEQLFANRSEETLLSSLVDGKEDAVTVTLFRVCCTTHSPNILGYTLRFLADLVATNRLLAELLGRPELMSRFGATPANKFLDFVNNHSDKLGIVNPAVYLACTALRYGPYDGTEEAFRVFFLIARHTFSPDVLQVADVEFMVQGCVQLARRKTYRSLFFQEGIVACIPRLLTDIVSSDSASIIQVIYETLLLTWLLSFEYEGVVHLVRARMIPQLHRVLQRVQKEKCVRVALMALHNMAEAERTYIRHLQNPSLGEWHDPRLFVLGRLHQDDAHALLRKGPSLVAEMVGVGMLKTLSQLARRKFGDEDIGVLVEELEKALEQSMEILTSFSEYRGEVLSGALEWGPVHTSAKFWKENVVKFEDSGYEVLNALGAIILDTHSDVTLAVACHDLGEVVRYHPTGRHLLTLASMTGVKERVMLLMSHQNPEVAKEALLCTQKIMVQRWEYIQQA